MKNYNIIQIIIDANRYYHGNSDEKYKLNVFKKLKNLNFIEFEKMVVSAPSTLMSLMTMLTGQNSFSLSANYNDLDFYNKKFVTLNDLLKKKNYKSYAVASTKLFREFVAKEFNIIENVFLPKEINLSQFKWSNKEIFLVTKKMIEEKVLNKNNFFLLLWFNSRHDLNTSRYVEDSIKLLSKQSFFDETIFIVSADHGYPDKIRGLVSDGEDLKKRGIPHDTILTNDNICVPFSIKFPKSLNLNISNETLEKLKKITIPQSYIFNTIIKILDIRTPSENIILEKDNIIDIINNPDDTRWNNQFLRSDSRFIFQPNKKTSISNANFKLISNYDGTYEFYNLKEDYKEILNLINDVSKKDNIEKFKNFLNENNEILFKYWEKKNFNNSKLKNYLKNNTNKLLIKYIGDSDFILFFLKINYEKYKIYLDLENKLQKKLIIDMYPNIKFFNAEKNSRIIILIDDTLNEKNLIRLNKINSKIEFIIDVNINIYKNKLQIDYKIIKNKFLNTLRNFFYRKNLYKKNKMLLLKDIIEILARGFKRIGFLIIKK